MIRCLVEPSPVENSPRPDAQVLGMTRHPKKPATFLNHPLCQIRRNAPFEEMSRGDRRGRV